MAEQDSSGVRLVDGLPVVSAPGQIDVTNSDTLGVALLSACDSSATVVADLSETTFCDSSGLSAIIQASRKALAAGGELRLVTSSAYVLRIFTLTGMDKKLRILASLTQALAG